MTGDMVVPNRIFVGGLPANANLDELQKYFCKIGEEIGARVVDIKIKMDVRGCSEGYGFVTFDEEKHVKKILNLDKEKFKFQEKILNIQQAYYTARRRTYGSTNRDKSRGYRQRIEHDSNDADDYYEMSPGSGLVSPNMLKSSENDGSELSKIYSQHDDNNNNVFSGSEKDDEPSSSSAMMSSSNQAASEVNATQSCTSTNSLPSSNDVAGKCEPTESGGEWTDQSKADKPEPKLDALNPRQLLESMRNQNRNAPGANRAAYYNPQGQSNSSRKYPDGSNRQGRNGSFRNDHNQRSNSASKSRPPSANQNQYYRSNSISSGNKNHFRNLTVDTRPNNQFNKKLFSPLTYLASRNAASLNQSQGSPYSSNGNNNISNQALGYYYAMATAAAAAAAAGSPSVMSPQGSMPSYKGVNPNAKLQYQPSFRQGQRPSLQLDSFPTTCYAGSVLNSANENMYTTIVNSANNNVGSEQASISHFLSQADMPASNDYSQCYGQNPGAYYQGQMAHPAAQNAPMQPKYSSPASLAAAKYVNHSVSLNSCAAVTTPSSVPPSSKPSNSQLNNNKENASSYDMNQQQQQAEHESRLSSTSKSSIANEISVNTAGAYQPPQYSSPYGHHSASNASEPPTSETKDSSQTGQQQGQYSYASDANVDRVQEMMAKNLNLNDASQSGAQQYAPGNSDLSRPYFVRPPAMQQQYATTYHQAPGPGMMVSPSGKPPMSYQPNVAPPHQYVYCYNALPSHMIQQQSRIITSGPLVGSPPVQMPSPMHHQVPAHLSAPVSVVFASNQQMAYSMAMSPQQQQQHHMSNYNSQMGQSNFAQPGQPLAVQLTSPSGAPVAYLSPNPNYHPMYQQQYPAPVYANSHNSYSYYNQPPQPNIQQQQQQQQQMSSSYTDNQNTLPTYPADSYQQPTEASYNNYQSAPAGSSAQPSYRDSSEKGRNN